MTFFDLNIASARREGNWFCRDCGEANWSYSLQCRKFGCYQFQHCSAQDEEIESEELEGRRECEEIQYTDVSFHKTAEHIDNKAKVDTTEEVIDVVNSKTKETEFGSSLGLGTRRKSLRIETTRWRRIKRLWWGLLWRKSLRR